MARKVAAEHNGRDALSGTRQVTEASGQNRVVGPPAATRVDVSGNGTAPAPVTLHDTLQLIVDKLSEALPGSMADLSMLDEADGKMLVVAHHGLPAGSRDSIWFPASPSIAYRAISRNEAVCFSDVFAQSDFPAAQESARQWGFRSILCVPLPLETPRYALLILLPYEHDFSSAEIAYASAVGKQAAVAIRNAQFYEQQLRLVQELTDLNSILEREKRELKSAVAMHDELTELLLSGGGIEEIASTLARSLGRPVLVEDQFFDMLVYAHSDGSSSTSPDHSPGPEALSAHDLHSPDALASLRKKRRVAYVPGDGGPARGRLIAPILAASEHLGYVSVLGVSAAPSWFELMAVERSTAMLAVELLNQKAVLDAELRLKSNYLDELLANPDQQTLLRRAGALGFDFRRPFAVLLVQPDPGPQGLELADDPARSAAFLKAVERAVEVLSERVLVLPRDAGMIVLASPRKDEDVAYPMRFAEAFHAEAARRWRSCTLSVAVGPTCPDWRSLPRAVAEVGRTSQALRRLGVPGQVANLEQLGVFGIVLEGAEDLDIDRFCERMIGALEAHDQSRGGELVATLRTYLNCNGNARKAARALNIHINTIRHRLANIETLTARDLDDPDVRLNFHIALRLAASRAVQKQSNVTGLARRTADRMSAE